MSLAYISTAHADESGIVPLNFHGKVFSRTFMFTRPVYSSVPLYEQGWHAIARNKDEGCNAYQMVLMGEHCPVRSRFSTYFTFDNKTCLLVAGDSAPVPAPIKRDVRAEWLRLPNTTYKEMSLECAQDQYAAMFVYERDLPLFDFFPCTIPWTVSVIAPLSLVRNTLRVCEHSLDHNQSPDSLARAFDQSDWCFSRINGTNQKIRLAELRVQFGSIYRADNFFEFSYYSVVSIPTGNKPSGKLLFEPVVGLFGHAGWGGGLKLQVPLHHNTDCIAWSFFANLEGILLFRRTMKRTFDLLNKPWSRYMLFNIDHCPPVNIPGVNLLTFNTVSHPYGMFDASFGWRLRTDHVELEAGYAVWGHGQERVNITHPILQRFGIAGVGSYVNGVGTTSSQSTIAQRSPNDTNFTAITPFDIDWNSGALQSSLNQQAFGAISFIVDHRAIQCFFGAGVMADVPQKNRPLFGWVWWLKGGASF